MTHVSVKAICNSLGLTAKQVPNPVEESPAAGAALHEAGPLLLGGLRAAQVTSPLLHQFQNPFFFTLVQPIAVAVRAVVDGQVVGAVVEDVHSRATVGTGPFPGAPGVLAHTLEDFVAVGGVFQQVKLVEVEPKAPALGAVVNFQPGQFIVGAPADTASGGLAHYAAEEFHRVATDYLADVFI